MTNQRPKVTIITTVLNGNSTISQAIESVINQSYKNIEYIVIDGGSSDGTQETIKKYISHIFKFISEPDTGIANSWNKALKFASGEIIGFLNCDDVYSVKSVESAIASLNIDELEICYGDTVLFNEKNQLITKIFGKFDPTKLHRGFGFMHTSCFATSKVYNKIGYFDESYKIAIDTEFMLRCIIGCVKFKKYDGLNYMRTGGISNRMVRRARREYERALINHKFYHPFGFKFILGCIFNRCISFISIENYVDLKVQVRLFILFVYNQFFRIVFFHGLKRSLLRLTGCSIDDRVFLHSPITFLSVGKIKIESGSTICNNSIIDNRRNISIGKNVMIAHNCRIYTVGHDYHCFLLSEKSAPVIIGNYVVIFSNVQIMPGVEIEDGAVILPGSVVTGRVGKNCIVGGIPASTRGMRNEGYCYNLNYKYYFAT